MGLLKARLVTTFLVLSVFGTASAQPAQNGTGSTMTNADVIALAGAGLTDDIVIAKIQAAPATQFDTSVTGLKALKAANVSSAVIRAMIVPHQPAASGTPFGPVDAVPIGDPDDPKSQHRPGIYVLSKGADSKIHMTKLEGEKPRGTRSSGAFTHALTQGLSTSKTQQVIDGAKAPVELSDTKPVFYAYIPENRASFSGGMSVRDITLTRLVVKDDTRLWTMSSRGVFGGSNESGSDQKDRQGFTSDEISPGIFKLTPAADLTAGQYAFKYAFSFFDFGVEPR